jgi:hypothetical protein
MTLIDAFMPRVPGHLHVEANQWPERHRGPGRRRAGADKSAIHHLIQTSTVRTSNAGTVMSHPDETVRHETISIALVQRSEASGLSWDQQGGSAMGRPFPATRFSGLNSFCSTNAPGVQLAEQTSLCTRVAALLQQKAHAHASRDQPLSAETARHLRSGQIDSRSDHGQTLRRRDSACDRTARAQAGMG